MPAKPGSASRAWRPASRPRRAPRGDRPLRLVRGAGARPVRAVLGGGRRPIARPGRDRVEADRGRGGRGRSCSSSTTCTWPTGTRSASSPASRAARPANGYSCWVRTATPTRSGTRCWRDRRPAARLRRRAGRGRGPVRRRGGSAARRNRRRTPHPRPHRRQPVLRPELARHLADRRDAAATCPRASATSSWPGSAGSRRTSAEALTSASVLGERFDLAVLEQCSGRTGCSMRSTRRSPRA